MRMRINRARVYLLIITFLFLYIKLYFMQSQCGTKVDLRRNSSAPSILPHNHSQLETKEKFTVLFLSLWHGYDAAKLLRIPECDDEVEVTSNRSAIDRADAVVFGYEEFDNNKNYYLSRTHSALRNPNVAFILAIQESAHHNEPMKPNEFDGIFNFLWMLRRDADIHHDFQEMYDKYEKPDEKWSYGTNFSNEFLKNKTKLAAWVVANCRFPPSGRNKFVEELAKHGITVDIYGRCGNRTCEGIFQGNNCFPRLGKEYKFYMSLENSLCLDYITEKPAHGWENGMIPIIWALGKKELAAPPGSYIDALEFNSTKELAERIKYLDKNPKEYFKYFEWRKLYNTTLSYHAAYHCYVWRKIKKLTMELRANVTVNPRSALGRKNLEFWRAYFYNEKVNMNCRNCVSGFNVTHPRQNLFKLYNNPRCVKAFL